MDAVHLDFGPCVLTLLQIAFFFSLARSPPLAAGLILPLGNFEDPDFFETCMYVRILMLRGCRPFVFRAIRP